MRKSAKYSRLNFNERKELKQKIASNHNLIRAEIKANHVEKIYRTQACNRKVSHACVEDDRAERADLMSQQIKVWRSLLPNILRRFAKIKDPRQPGKLKHKMAVLMMFGLFAFIFRLQSRREINREQTGPLIFEHLKKLFPEIDSIPHADSLARILARINPVEIERIHISMIKELIASKKFKHFLLDKQYLPIAIDGTQKLTRDGELQDPRWLERVTGNKHAPILQQYVYLIEANITLKNGLIIPQLKILLLLDALFATFSVMNACFEKKLEFIINLPKAKLKTLSKTLSRSLCAGYEDWESPYYNERKQTFRWNNLIPFGFEGEYNITTIACSESWREVNKTMGEVVAKHVEYAWISSVPISIGNVFELCNHGVRKKNLIEEGFNTQKNRGYRHKHAFSYDWWGMQNFHLLMRMGYAINAISEFTQVMKQYIKRLGVGAVLKKIKETIFSNWLSLDWYNEQQKQITQLRFQLE